MNREEYQNTIRDHLKTSYNLTNEKIESVLPRFLDMLSVHMDKLENIIETGSIEALEKAGHTLKGALLNLGLHDLAQDAFVIEQISRDPNESTDYSMVVAKLKAEIDVFA